MSTTNLFLTSYFAGVAKLLPDRYGNLAGKRVAFITTASKVEKVTFYIGTSKKSWAKLGAAVDELDLSEVSPAEIRNRIQAADILFVDGGNTFYLLQELKRTGADSMIREHIALSKLYVGASAGSMVVCPNIEYVTFMDDKSKAPLLNSDFTALHIVDFTVVPHCTDFPFKKSAEKILETYDGTLDLKPINNKQAVVVHGKSVQIVTA